MSEVVTAPMTGKVIEVVVSVGDKVEEDDTVVVFEAMKMETPLGSPIDGTVTKVMVKAGDQVDADTPLVAIE